MQDWSKLTVVQLKEHLKERGLPLSGKKADLVARLQELDKEAEKPGAEEAAPPAEEQQDDAQPDEGVQPTVEDAAHPPAANDDVPTQPAPKEDAAQPAKEDAAQPAKEASTRKRKHEPIPAPPAKKPSTNTPPTAEPAPQPSKPAPVAEPAPQPKKPTPVAEQPRKPSVRPPGDGPPLTGEPTSALRIDGFVRPFTEPAAKSMLAEHGNIVAFWMPTIKTHCYVVYETAQVATAAAEAVHNVEWPVGNNSKLKVKYVGAEEAADAIAVGRGEKLPSGAQTAPEELAAEPVKAPKEAKEALTLEDLFKKTAAQPAIYWLPLAPTAAASKPCDP